MNLKYAGQTGLFGLLLAALVIPPVSGQTFSSGSTGSDGALTYATPGTYTFDPMAFTPPLDADGDGVFNFTSITIAAGVTLRLRGDVYAPPVIWLASGAVKIDGTIDASGQAGFSAANTTQRTNTISGSGGYAGGYPGVGQGNAGSGLGPGGGAVCTGTIYNRSGIFTGNQFLVPLVGGSGGGGSPGWAGGAGGGAILIASSLNISGTGSVRADGGTAPNNTAGVGSGGSIRLVAPSVTLSGLLNAAGGSNNNGCGGVSSQIHGIVRIEAFQIGPLNVTGGFLYTATPFGLFINPSATPSVRVVSVGGNAVATSPTGTFTVPDVTVNSSAALPVVIQATNVPVGTIVTLVIFSENGPDQTIQSPPLAGTLASSTATATVTLPPGFSKGFVKASF